MVRDCQPQEEVALERVEGMSRFQELVLNPMEAAGLGSLGVPSERST